MYLLCFVKLNNYTFDVCMVLILNNLVAVATPRYAQGVPKNTLSWEKKLYILIKKFICLPFKQN